MVIKPVTCSMSWPFAGRRTALTARRIQSTIWGRAVRDGDAARPTARGRRMDAPPAAPSSNDDQTPHRVPSWVVWALLIGAGIGLRLWVIARTEVAARDSVGFIRYALRLEAGPL